MKPIRVLPLLLATVLTASAQDAPVDWKTLATEFAQDQAAAEAKYQDKMITVTGPVSSIVKGDMTVDASALAVTLSSPDGPGADVKCLFEDSDLAPQTEYGVPDDDGSEAVLRKRDSAGNVVQSQPFVQTGQQVTITGSFVNFDAGDIVLRHCRLGGQ